MDGTVRTYKNDNDSQVISTTSQEIIFSIAWITKLNQWKSGKHGWRHSITLPIVVTQNSIQIYQNRNRRDFFASCMNPESTRTAELSNRAKTLQTWPYWLARRNCISNVCLWIFYGGATRLRIWQWHYTILIMDEYTIERMPQCEWVSSIQNAFNWTCLCLL